LRKKNGAAKNEVTDKGDNEKQNKNFAMQKKILKISN
jgi:hypothetical protein